MDLNIEHRNMQTRIMCKVVQIDIVCCRQLENRVCKRIYMYI